MRGPCLRRWVSGSGSRPCWTADRRSGCRGSSCLDADGFHGGRAQGFAAPGPVGGGSVEVVGAVWSVDGDDSVFVEGQSPASLVHEVVMFRTQRQQIVQIRSAVAEPFDHVVDVAAVEGHVASGVGAGAVHRPQRPPLRPVRDPVVAAAVEHLAGAVEHDRHDRRFTGQAAHCLGWEWDPVGGLT